MALAALVVGGFSLPPYLTGDPSVSRIPLNPAVALHLLYISAHAVPAVLALVIGPFQFVTAVRVRYPALHRVLGRVYLVSVLVASVMGAFSAAVATTGLVAQVGFFLLVLAWLYTGVQAYRTIRRGQVQLHRVWMIRNYALTLSAVFLRVFIGLGAVVMARYPSVTFEEIYHLAVWVGWTMPLILAEWFVVQRTLSSAVRRRTPASKTPASGTGAAPVAALTRSGAPAGAR